ncbi:hypothetical protein EJ03DRAFT_356806 [Teratosphaeria nubilosa]|uniref:Uncharacterized protein n=1 Tax=Teratosphaeria nubilosa TaxID=161662 RepID=A0A6G1LP95_9PEZI|nr:hypothetical protein EJ03DRAFT_356806 [Teratosphaeria nubilosa]
MESYPDLVLSSPIQRATLPDDLQLQIFEHIYGVCKIRRNKVLPLQAMNLMHIRLNDPPYWYQSHLWACDQSVRRAAGLSHRERQYYVAITNNTLKYRQDDMDNHLSRVAQRNWLSRTSALTRTCVSTTDATDDLITQADRRELTKLRLATSPTHWFNDNLIDRDGRIYKRMVSCWVQVLARMPAHVLNVVVIAKKPDVPFLQPDVDEQYLAEIRTALRDIGGTGKDVYGGELLEGQEIPID